MKVAGLADFPYMVCILCIYVISWNLFSRSLPQEKKN